MSAGSVNLDARIAETARVSWRHVTERVTFALFFSAAVALTLWVIICIEAV